MSARAKGGRPRKTPTSKSSGARQRRDARENHGRIVRVAAQVFAERGLGATLADVAREAGVGIGTMYRCFANKDDLILAVYAERFVEVEQQVLAASQANDPWDGLVRYFETSARALAADRGFREFVMGGYSETVGWARGATPDRILALLERANANIRGYMTTLVRRARRAGALRRDVQPTDMLVLTIAMHATVEFGGAKYPDLHRRIIGIMLDGLRTSRRSPSPLPVDPLTNEQVAAMRGLGRGT